MPMTGMDIAQVRQLATQMQHAGDQVKTLTQQLTSALHSTSWVGADKSRFEGDWNGSHVKALNAVAQALDEASKLANKNAQEQEQASS